jgi:Mg2+/Co2+ transporter CorB
MTHRRSVEAIDIELTPREVVAAMLNSPHTRMPLCQGGLENIIGVLHAKDVLRALQAAGGDPNRLDIRRIAARPWFIPDTTSLLDQLHAFRTRREHFAIVVDEYGDLKGVVTLEDILEEIVGDIVDEHDLPVAGVRPQANGSFLIDGTVTIRDLNRRFEWRLPDDEASTVAGLVLHEARHLPEVGQAFTFHGFRFEILRRQRNQITAVRLTPPAEIEPEEG